MTLKEESMLEQLARRRRAERAVALASLLARGAREYSTVASLAHEKLVGTGVGYLEEELVEELHDLLGLCPRTAD